MGQARRQPSRRAHCSGPWTPSERMLDTTQPGQLLVRFAEVLVGLPMLSLFLLCRPCDERESFQNRCLGSCAYST